MKNTVSFKVKIGCIAVLALDIFLQTWLRPSSFLPENISYYRDLDQNIRFIAEVVGEPDLRSDGQNLVVEARQMYVPGLKTGGVAGMTVAPEMAEASGKVMVKADRYPERSYGGFLDISCRLQTPPVFEKFSYAALLAKDDIFSFCTRPVVKEVSLGIGEGGIQPSGGIFGILGQARRGFWRTVFSLKSVVLSRVNELYAEPQASLAAGILVGARRAIPADILDDFNTAGLTHVLAISGYNVSMMITVFGYLFQGAARRRRYAGMFCGVLGLVAFTGFSASVLRAAWMGCITLVAQMVGRKGSGLHLLLVSGVIMVLFSPRMILVDLSFQLSFLSTLGILLFMPKIEAFEAKLTVRPGFRWLSKIPSFMREGFYVTLAAQVFTTPLLFYQFGRFSVIAPVANIFVLPLVPWIMLFSFAGLAVSFLLFPIGQLLSYGAYVLVTVMLVLVDFFARLPLAALQF